MTEESSPQQGPIPKQWQELLPKIEEATHFYPCPAADFDPMKLSDDGVDPQNRRMEDYGLPPRPNKDRFPVRYEFWKKMFSGNEKKPSVTFVPASFQYEHVEVNFAQAEAKSLGPVEAKSFGQGKGSSFLPFRRFFRARGIGKGVARPDTSVNWCGAYVTAHDGRIITEIHGSWKVPRVDVPDGIQVTELKPHEELRCSSWLGLDGQRGYLDASLPQIGTSHFVKRLKEGVGREPRLGVWWQWWLRGVPNPPPIKLPLEVEAGDEIMASLFVVNSTHVKYLIVNHTKGVVCTPFKETEPSSYLSGILGTPPLADIPVRVSGATGEWITERPVNWTTGEPDNLPFFEDVVFEDCHVVLGRAPNVDEWEEQPLGTQLINATSVDKDVSRTVMVVRAERRGPGTFSTSFIGKPTKILGGAFRPGQ